MSAEPSLELVDPDDQALCQTILNGVRTFNADFFSGHPEGKDLAIAIRDADGPDAVGGLLGRTAGGWLAVDLLFVPETYRGQGLATKLIAMAEEEAIRRGCHSAWLDTLNPKALTLYQRLGYEIFGELKDYPVGYSRFFLRKKLASSQTS